MGSGTDEHRELSEPLGVALARMGVHLLTGGGGGVMTAVSRAFASVGGRRGMTIGVIPGKIEAGLHRPRAGYPNPWIEIAVFTHLPLSGRDGTQLLSRNHINVLTADVVVALPGSWGTASEVALALEYRRPLVALVRRQDDIPGLAQAVRRVPNVESAVAFVREQLGARLTQPPKGSREGT